MRKTKSIFMSLIVTMALASFLSVGADEIKTEPIEKANEAAPQVEEVTERVEMHQVKGDEKGEVIFNDLPTDNWAYPYVMYLYKQGVVFGYPDSSYRPDDYVTRAEFSSMVVRALDLVDKPVETIYNFNDLPSSHWAYPYVEIAANHDLVVGTPDGYFLPDDHVKRLEVVSVVASALNLSDISEAQAKEVLSVYKDAAELPDWALVKAAKAWQAGIIINSPEEEGYLAPLRPATRGEMAGFLVAMIEKAKYVPNEKIKPQPKIIDGYVLDNVYIDKNVAYIPAGTILPLAVMDCFSCKEPFDHSRTAKVGEPFSARATKNFVTKDKILVIPIGTRFEGKIRKVKKELFFIRNGKIVLTTDTMIRANTVNETAKFPALADIDPRLPKKDFWSKFSYYVIKHKNVWVHKGQLKEFILSEPIQIDVLTNWVPGAASYTPTEE